MMNEKQKYEEFKKQLPPTSKPDWCWDTTLAPPELLASVATAQDMLHQALLEMVRQGVSPWDIEMVFEGNAMILGCLRRASPTRSGYVGRCDRRYSEIFPDNNAIVSSDFV